MSLGTLTVIVPMYNCCENVIRTLKKLKDQSANYAKRLEVIVVDDGSTDNLVGGVLSECEQDGFEFYNQVYNKGGAAACNKGIELAHGDYLTFVDADDSITDDYLGAILSEIEDKKYDFITHRWMYPNGDLGGRHEPPLVNWNVWGNVYRTNLAKPIRFDEDLNVAWDMDWLKRFYTPGMSWLDSAWVTNIYDTSNPESITNKFQRGEIKVRKSDTSE